MNYGIQHTRGLQMLSRLMSNHGGGQRPCPPCESSDLTTTVLEHVQLAHGGETGIKAKTTVNSSQTAPHLSVLLLNLETCLTTHF